MGPPSHYSSALPCPQWLGVAVAQGTHGERWGCVCGSCDTARNAENTEKAFSFLFFLQKRMEISQTAETPLQDAKPLLLSLHVRNPHPCTPTQQLWAASEAAVPCRAIPCSTTLCHAMLCQGAQAPADALGQKRRALIRAVLAPGLGEGQEPRLQVWH